MIEDRFEHAEGLILVRSPRQNLRHVASADSFSAEEFDAATERIQAGPGPCRSTREIEL